MNQEQEIIRRNNMNNFKEDCIKYFGREIDSKKYAIFKFDGSYNLEYGLSPSRNYISSLNSLDELKEYLSTIYSEVPEFLNFIDFDKMKNNLTEKTVRSLDKTLGRDFEEQGDDGYGSCIYTNRKTLCAVYDDTTTCYKEIKKLNENIKNVNEDFSSEEVESFLENNFEIKKYNEVDDFENECNEDDNCE
jgi:hypothetical protein